MSLRGPPEELCYMYRVGWLLVLGLSASRSLSSDHDRHLRIEQPRRGARGGYPFFWYVGAAEPQPEYASPENLRAANIETGRVKTPDQPCHGAFDGPGANCGLWPQIVVAPDGNTTLVNGGVPENANLSAHLAQLEHDIPRWLPSTDWDGFAVVDFEAYTPVWQMNAAFGKHEYLNASLELARSRHPQWSVDAQVIDAKQRFESAAMDFFVETLRTCRRLRPKARWGYYGWPDHFYLPCNRSVDAATDQWRCSYDSPTADAALFRSWNDQLVPVWRSSGAIYPSIYIPAYEAYPHPHTPGMNAGFVTAVVKEAMRVAAMGAVGADLPVVPFHLNYYHHGVRRGYGEFLNATDLETALTLPMRLGATGTILWGSGEEFKDPAFPAFLMGTLEPLTKRLRLDHAMTARTGARHSAQQLAARTVETDGHISRSEWQCLTNCSFTPSGSSKTVWWKDEDPAHYEKRCAALPSCEFLELRLHLGTHDYHARPLPLNGTRLVHVPLLADERYSACRDTRKPAPRWWPRSPVGPSPSPPPHPHPGPPPPRAQPCAHVVDGVCDAGMCGFNAIDATDALQSAIDSTAHTVRVTKQAVVWSVRPVVLRSNLTVVFEDGVVVRALRGAFHGKSDALLTAYRISNITLLGEGNATLAMWRSDYANRSMYGHSEGRAALMLHSVHDLRVDNLQVSHSGGDGLYLADIYTAHIRNIRSLWNYRQGMSIIEAFDTLIEHSEFSFTAGTAPASGVDIENDRPTQRFQNLTLRNCTARDNVGKGFEISMHGCEGGPTDIVFDELTVVGGGDAGFYLHLPSTNASSQCVGGAVLRRSRTAGTRAPGVFVYETGAGALTVNISDVLINATRNPTGIYIKATHRYPTGGVTMDDMSIYTHSGQPYLVMTTDSEPVENVKVNATVHTSNRSACVPVLVSTNHSSNIDVFTDCKPFEASEV